MTISLSGIQHIFCANKEYDWMQTHATNPVAMPRNNKGDCRIFFNTRDKQNRANVAYLDLNVYEPAKLQHVSQQPVFKPGELGLFDDDGISIGNIVKINNRYHFYYTGWNLCQHVPWRNSIGLATCDDVFADDVTFERFSNAPILDRNHDDPYSLSYPYVMADENNYKMWYGCNTNWCKHPSDMLHAIKYAESADGINWHRPNIISIAPTPEYPAASKPCVFKLANGQYQMWYSPKSTIYHIAAADSSDGKQWQPHTHFSALIDIPWANQMIAYPDVFSINGDYFLLFCGNDYGRSGFGIAKINF